MRMRGRCDGCGRCGRCDGCDRSALRCRGVDDGLDGRDDIGGKSSVGGVTADDVFVWGDVDAVDLVGRDIGVDPLDLRTDVPDDGAGVLGGGYKLGGVRSPTFGMLRSMRNLGMGRSPSLGSGARCFFTAEPKVNFAPEEYVMKLSRDCQIVILR